MPEITEEERVSEFRRRQAEIEARYADEITRMAPERPSPYGFDTTSRGTPAPQRVQPVAPQMSDDEWQSQLAEERRLSMEGANYAGPIAAGEPGPSQMPDNPPPEIPQQTAEPAAAYQGQAYPGLPVLIEGGEASYGGRGYGSEEEAMAARERDAATNIPAQQAYRANMERRAALQAQEPGGQAASQPTSIQIRAEMDRHQLSPADQLELRQTQNGVARLQRDIREGRVPAIQGAILEARLRERMAPKMVTMSQLRGLEHAYRVQLMRESVMHQTQANAAAQHYMQANFQGPQISPDGRWAQTAPGRWEPAASADPRQQRQTGGSGEPRPLTAAQTAGLRRSAEQAVRRDPAFIGKPEAEITRAIQERVQRWTAEPGADTLTPPRPIDLPDDAPLSQLPADQRGILRGLNADQAALTGPNSRLNPDEKTELTADIARFRSLFRQFGQVSSMPATERTEFLAIARRLDELTGRHRGPGARQTPEPASAPAASSADVPL